MKLIFIILTIFSIEYLSANIENKSINIKSYKQNKEILSHENLNIIIYTRGAREGCPPRKERITRKSRNARATREVRNPRIVSFRKRPHKINKIHLTENINPLYNKILNKGKITKEMKPFTSK